MAFLDETGLATLWSQIDEKFTRFEFGEYTGTGGVGSSSPNSLTFSFVPSVVLMLGYRTSATAKEVTRVFGRDTSPNSGSPYYAVFPPVMNNTGNPDRSAGGGFDARGYYTSVGWCSPDRKTIYWYTEDSSSTTQFNAPGYIYYYFAIG